MLSKFACRFERARIQRVSVFVCLACVLIAEAAHAQSPRISDTSLLGVPHSFARYASPGECARDAGWVEQQFWRTRRMDTVYVSKAGQSNQPVTIEQVRACVARFVITATPTTDLLGLGQAYLSANLLDKADSALSELALRAQTAKKYPWILHQIAAVYLEAASPRLDRAVSYVSRLDALGPRAAVERMLTHRLVAARAQVIDSVPLWEHELRATLLAGRSIAGEQRQEYAEDIARTYIDLARVEIRKFNPDGARAIIDTGRRVVSSVLPGAEVVFEWSRSEFELIGRKAPPIVAGEWINKVDSTEFGTRPCPSLVVFGPGGDYSSAVLRRLIATYGSQGFHVTVVMRTQGYFIDRLVSADTEIIRWSDYIIRWRGLPVSIAFWKTPTGRRDDGRIVALESPNEDAYHPPQFGQAGYILDSDGIVRMVVGISRDNEVMIDDVLRILFNGARASK